MFLFLLTLFLFTGGSLSTAKAATRSSRGTFTTSFHQSRQRGFTKTNYRGSTSVFRLHGTDKWDNEANGVTSTKPGPLIPRSANNYMAKWQSKGDHYVSYENLQRLDRIVNHGGSGTPSVSNIGNKSRNQNKKELFSELSLTYFARFHNMIREEYQFEKKVIEDRLKVWPVKRLRKEGFVLLDMLATPKGNLFQEKVYRFSSSYNDKLPFHRFGVGDSVRISVGRYGDPLRDDGIDGVVLDRRQKYLDVCLRSSDAAQMTKARGDRFRLDTFVNRVTFDRMVEALQLFLQPTGSVFVCLRISLIAY